VIPIPIALAAFVLLVVTVFLLARPFVAPVRSLGRTPLPQLHADLERLRAQLRELDMDFETGKLAPGEYERLRARRLEQIRSTTRAILEAEGVPAGGEPVVVPAELERELERRIAERKRALEASAARTCPRCGTTTEPDDRSCRGCGVELSPVEVTDR
jgi:hypothetical protein